MVAEVLEAPVGVRAAFENLSQQAFRLPKGVNVHSPG